MGSLLGLLGQERSRHAEQHGSQCSMAMERVRLALEVNLVVRTKGRAMEPWAVTQQVVLAGEVAEGPQETL